VRVLLADDSLLLRAGVARLLQDAGFEVVAEAGDLDDLLRKVRAHKPDVAVVDIKMPPTHTDEGLKAAQIVRSELPGTGVLVLSQYVEKEYGGCPDSRGTLSDGPPVPSAPVGSVRGVNQVRKDGRNRHAEGIRSEGRHDRD
jgi:CheY-like chemotaxis protein